jgi:PD-(D/E)XK nuclease superfamily
MPQPKLTTKRPNIATGKRIKSWSFTRFDDWNRCPAYAKYKHLDKLPEPKSEAMQRGADIAKASEEYLLKRTNRLRPELKTFAEHYKFYRSIKGLVVEENWGFDVNWNPVPWDDWNRCVLRVKIDIGYHWMEDNSFNVRDGKTGKFRPEQNSKYELQLQLYAAAASARFPEVRHVTTQLLYTDLGITYPEEEPQEYSMKECKAIIKDWDKRIKPMFADTTFAPRPGDYCRWCPFSKSKGGPCKF